MLTHPGLIGAAGVSTAKVTPVFVRTHADLSSASNVAELTSGSWVVDGSNKLLFSAIGSGAGTPVDPSGVKWGGSGGTALSKQGSTLNVGVYGKISVYSLIAPTSTTSTSYYLWPGNQDETAGGTVLITGVHQTVPFGTFATATGNFLDNTASLNITSEVGDLVIAVLWLQDMFPRQRTISVDGGTLLYDARPADYEFIIIQSKTATTTTTTMAFTSDKEALNSGLWGIIGVAVKPI